MNGSTTPRSTMRSTSGSPPRKMTNEEIEKTATRMCDSEVERRKNELQALDKKFYPHAPRQVMAKEQIDASVARQVDDEMQRRSKRNETLHTKHYKDDEAKRLTTSELEESVRRIYEETLRLKHENRHKMDEKYTFKNKSDSIKRLDGDQVKASAIRLAVPKKREFSTEDFNKAYGF